MNSCRREHVRQSYYFTSNSLWELILKIKSFTIQSIVFSLSKRRLKKIFFAVMSRQTMEELYLSNNIVTKQTSTCQCFPRALMTRSLIKRRQAAQIGMSSLL